MLIDTHILLWFQGEPERLTLQERELIEQAQENDELFVSVISFWEITMLSRSQRVTLCRPFEQWKKETLNSFKVIDIDVDIAVESMCLPECDHKDPADRFIIATARMQDFPLMTRDQKILAYAKKGHVRLV